MANLHRLQWIDGQIRAGRYPNARSLAAEFEISHRQALRDFEYLRDSLGAPLEYSALHRGYTYTAEAFALPGPYVTPAQRSMLGHLAAYYADVARHDSRAGSAYAGIAALLERLGGAASGQTQLPLPQDSPVQQYRAIVQMPPGPPPSVLAPYWRGEGACEFTDPRAFLRAVLTAGVPMRVEWPRWLRERLAEQLQTFLQMQADTTRHVTPTLVSSHRDQIQGRMVPMNARATTPARFDCSWTSYAGAAHGVLTAAGMFEPDFTRFMGLSGMAFHLIMHQECCISSVTVYDWVYEHQAALERLGILSEVFQSMPDSPAYAAACRRAVENIKAAVDRGTGVILWGVDTGEFGVIYGYDDEDGVLQADGCAKFGPGSNPILYENVGRTFPDAPILHYQIPIAKVAVDMDGAYRSSLEYYVRHMESPQHIAPAYQAGLKAYDNWIGALETGKFSSTGLLYNLTVYADAKRHAAGYLQFLAGSWKGLPGLAEVADRFGAIAGLYGQMLEHAGHDLSQPVHAWGPVAPERAAGLVPLLRQARALEAEAVALVKAGLSAK